LSTDLASRIAGARWALAALLASATLQFALFLRWPGSPMYDVGYSIFAAQNLLAHGQLKSLNMLADYHGDLAQFAKIRWMVHFPPGHSLLYAAVMGLGLNAGAATKALGFAGLLAGGIGWISLARFLGASKVSAAVLAAVYPWLPFIGTAYQLYETEQVAVALTPWFCLLLLQSAPVSGSSQPAAPDGARFLAAILLALALVATKYSMAPVFPATALYPILQDHRRFASRSLWWKGTMLGLLVFPGLLFLLVNFAYGPRLQLASAQSPHFVFQFARNILNTTVALTLGWDSSAALLSRFAHVSLYRGLIDVISLASLAVWIAHFRRHPLHGRMRSFALLLSLMTLALWLSLAASTFLGRQQWDFSAEARLYMPITLLWLLCCAVSLSEMRASDLVRSAAFYALALPLLLTVAVALRSGLQAPNPAMPQSGIAWLASRDPAHAAFVSRFAASHGRKPDLLIGPSSIMNELAAPGLYNGASMPPGEHYWSSAALEVWTLTAPSQEKVVLDDFSGAAADQRVATPQGYPYVFHVFTFAPRKVHG
jgi:hypothetical protein